MIDRSVEGNHSQIAKVDFEKIDRVLDAVETAMLSVASKHQLRETKIERWRWDQPEILMSWAPFRHILLAGKNIRVLVKMEKTDLLNCIFESNVWVDAGNDLPPLVGPSIMRVHRLPAVPPLP